MLTAHFMQRVRERVGPEVDALALAQHIFIGLDTGDTEFVARVNKDGLRCFGFRAFCGRRFYVLIDTEQNRCVTILPAGAKLTRMNRDTITLKDD